MRLVRENAREVAEEMIDELGLDVNLDTLVDMYGELTNAYRRSGELVFTEYAELPAKERAEWLSLWDKVITARLAERLGVNRADVELSTDEATALTTVYVDDVSAYDVSMPPIHGKIFVRPVLMGWCARTYDLVSGQVIRTDWNPDEASIKPEVTGVKC